MNDSAPEDQAEEPNAALGDRHDPNPIRLAGDRGETVESHEGFILRSLAPKGRELLEAAHGHRPPAPAPARPHEADLVDVLAASATKHRDLLEALHGFQLHPPDEKEHQ